MVYCLSIITILNYKIQVFLEDPQKFYTNFPEKSFIENILCYISDINLTQTLNLKFVIESIIIDKMKKYLEFLLIIFFISHSFLH